MSNLMSRNSRNRQQNPKRMSENREQKYVCHQQQHNTRDVHKIYSYMEHRIVQCNHYRELKGE